MCRCKLPLEQRNDSDNMYEQTEVEQLVLDQLVFRLEIVVKGLTENQRFTEQSISSSYSQKNVLQ